MPAYFLLYYSSTVLSSLFLHFSNALLSRFSVFLLLFLVISPLAFFPVLLLPILFFLSFSTTIMILYWLEHLLNQGVSYSVKPGRYISLVPRLSKRARGGEEEESLVSVMYTCTSFTQILGKPYSVCASSVTKTPSLVM